MADSQNPYQAPAANLDGSTESANTVAFTPAMVQALKGTKPWVRFLSILGFVGCGLSVLGGLLFAVFAAVMPGLGGSSGNLGLAVMVAVAYLAFGGIGILPLLQLHKYANAIGTVERSASAQGIETALGNQRSFWRTAGIITLVVMGLYFALIFIAVIAGVFGAMSHL